MKNFFRLSVFLLLAGGWALASSALYVVRTPSKVLIFPKNQLGFHDTYVDTRLWTISDDRAHPALIGRIVQLQKCDAMSHTVDTHLGPVEVQLAAAVAFPTADKTNGGVLDGAKAELKSVSDAIKTKVN
jgi:hypothetical protein